MTKEICCIYCGKTFKPEDEICHISEHGLAHEADCVSEYIWERIRGREFKFKDLCEWDEQFYGEDGFYDDSIFLKPYDVYIDGEYFTTILSKSEHTVLSVCPIPWKKYKDRIEKGESIEIEVKETC